MKKTILITGGAGYIGTVLSNRLIDMGFRVVIVDNLKGGSIRNVNKRATFYKENILNKNIGKIFAKEKPEIIFHMAALKSVKDSLNNPLQFASVNILGSLNVIENAINNGIKNLVFMSTAGVYGDSIPNGGQIEHQTLKPSSPYAVSKLTIENYISYYNANGLNGIILRFANVYGKGGRSKVYGVVDKFIKEINDNKAITIDGNGKQTRDFIYIDDLVDLCVLLSKKYPKRSSENFIFNVSTGEEVSINNLVTIIRSELNTKFKSKYSKKAIVGQKRSVLNPKNTFTMFGWAAKTKIRDGVKKLI